MMSVGVATRSSGALQALAAVATSEPDRPLLDIDGETLTRADFMSRVSECSGALARHGVGAGDHVALVAPNGIEWCVVFWAAVNLGAVPVPLDPQIGAWELASLTRLIAPKLWVIVPRFRTADIAGSIASIVPEPARRVIAIDDSAADGLTPLSTFLRDAAPLAVPSREPAEAETLMLAFTSGTTGNPRLLVVPHRGFVRAQQDMASTLALTRDDRMLLGMPLYHQGGFGMGLQALLAGACASYRSVFEPEAFLDAIERDRVTVIQLSATLAKILLSSPTLPRRDLSSLRLAYFAGEVLPDEVARELWQRRGIRVINIIGSSETGTMVMWDSERDAAHSPSDFLPLPFTAVRVDAPEGEPGHLWVSTDALLSAYLGNERETASRLETRNGRCWFDTQDLALQLPNGRVRFVGRAKRVIKRGANLIHPEEIEAYLLTHPGIAAVGVQAAEHPLFGEAIVAHIQPAPGATLDRGALLAYCRGRIAAYKIPDRFELTERLPADIGKLQHKYLRRPSGD